MNPQQNLVQLYAAAVNPQPNGLPTYAIVINPHPNNHQVPLLAAVNSQQSKPLDAEAAKPYPKENHVPFCVVAAAFLRNRAVPSRVGDMSSQPKRAIPVACHSLNFQPEKYVPLYVTAAICQPK